jgi:ketosteroid isomerase-like protein
MTSRIVAFFGLATLALAAPGKDSAAQKSGTAAEVLPALEETWVNALQKGDLAALDALLADTYVDTDEGGQRGGKQDVMGALKSGDLKIKSIELSDMRVHPYGEAAVVTGSARQDASFKGQPLLAKVVFTDTFVKQGGKWRVVASHRSGVQGGP